MKQQIENIKEQLEEVIKKNLPEERTQDNLPFENSPEIYGNQRIEAYKKGFNQALSQINTSLIADEVLKVVVKKIKKLKHIELSRGEDRSEDQCENDAFDKVIRLLTLSPNKENKNNG